MYFETLGDRNIGGTQKVGGGTCNQGDPQKQNKATL